MNVQEVTDQKTWDAFVSALPWAQFTQSWVWGEFPTSLGSGARRFFVEEGGRVLAACQLVQKTKYGMGRWFAPRGPVFSAEGKTRARDVMRALLEGLDAVGMSRGNIYWRFEPLLTLEEAEGVFPLSMMRVRALEPAATSLLDLTKTEEELLAAMHQKTRYNIRVAEKHGVTVREGSAEDVETFLELSRETAARDGFQSHSDAHLRRTFEFLSSKHMATLRIAEVEGKALAANMEIRYGDTVTYLHGASSSASRDAMAPFALHWDAIRSAKAAGFATYDLYGVNPEYQSNPYYKPSWEGITRFKAGWGGTHVDLCGTVDFPLKSFVYAFVNRGQWWKMG